VLDESRREELMPRVVATLTGLEGVDLLAWREDDAAVVRSAAGELRFRPGDDLRDPRGASWSVEGEEAVLALESSGGTVTSAIYPDALGRLWSALASPHAGDVLISAEPGSEFVDWGGADHVGGGSHGSLHRDDSEGVLLMSGLDLPERPQWALTDVTPLVLQHFGVPSAG
jgi:hypothetical protein